MLNSSGQVRSKIFIYGPPGCGKSTLGRSLAQALDLPFWDLDDEIQRRSRKSIPEIFQGEGETGFRQRERRIIEDLLSPGEAVISLGGGALLDPETRARAEAAGQILFLDTNIETLLANLLVSGVERPLLGDEPATRLSQLLEQRSGHYESFRNRIAVESSLEDTLWQAQLNLGFFRVSGMGQSYDVRVMDGGLATLGELLRQRSFGETLALVSDEHVAAIYEQPTAQALQKAGFRTAEVQIPAGEMHKTPATVLLLWQSLIAAGLERGSALVALGGGVLSDLAGFAAATYLRGIPWVVVPTSLLGMIDASLGGKTGADLPEGKNLVGAFHAPRLVLADPQVLRTLPEEEVRSGMAEVVKHAVIADPNLFELCAHPDRLGKEISWEYLIRRAVGVKIGVIQADPFEKGARAALNLGHTVGHAVEAASNYRLRHGEAVSIGMIIAARLAEAKGIAENGLSAQIASVLEGLGLPTRIPGNLSRSEIIDRMRVDKKRAHGVLRFALPTRIGEVVVGVEVNADEIPWEA